MIYDFAGMAAVLALDLMRRPAIGNTCLSSKNRKIFIIIAPFDYGGILSAAFRTRISLF